MHCSRVYQMSKSGISQWPLTSEFSRPSYQDFSPVQLPASYCSTCCATPAHEQNGSLNGRPVKSLMVRRTPNPRLKYYWKESAPPKKVRKVARTAGHEALTSLHFNSLEQVKSAAHRGRGPQ